MFFFITGVVVGYLRSTVCANREAFLLATVTFKMIILMVGGKVQNDIDSTALVLLWKNICVRH